MESKLFADRMFRLMTSAALGTTLVLTMGALPAGAIVYTGAPDLELTARLVAAGSDRGTFHATTLFERAFAKGWPAERAHMRAKYGDQRVRDCFALMDYTVGDTLRIVKRDNVAVPAVTTSTTPLPAALWAAGQTPSGRYDVGYMLERLVSHAYHHEIMHDLDARFGRNANASFHIVLAALVADGHSAH